MTSKIEDAVFRAAGKLESHMNKPGSSGSTEKTKDRNKDKHNNTNVNHDHDDDGKSSPTSSNDDAQHGRDTVFDQGHRRAGPRQRDTDLSKETDGGSDGDGGPAGGFDDTPVPSAPPGYTLKFTFHRATNLPMADIATFSSDPYIHAHLSTSLPMRHKEDPPLRLRTPTVRRDTEPVWDTEWVVANVPASGFKLKCRIYDEDPADHDDRLGNVTIEVHGLNDEWPGIKEQAYKIKKRMASKRAYVMRGLAVALQKTKHMDGSLFVSVENLGRSRDKDGGRCYTLGPMWYTKHYSPMLGRLTGRKEPSKDEDTSKCAPKSRKAERYNFQANQFQMKGPVPPELYHRFVEFKPFVKRMFTSSGIEGFLLSKALHHQHARVYNFDRTTEYGLLGETPSLKSTHKFLDLVHWDEGGRIFTYVLTLDALFRFTETGKEFGIDFLSKHTMHSDVNIYIAYSGEFFVRRLKYKNRKTPEEHLHNPAGYEDEDEQDRGNPNGPVSPGRHHHVQHRQTSSSQSGGSISHSQNRPTSSGRNSSSRLAPHSPSDQTEEHPPLDLPTSQPIRDPSYYELVIDNDSGTYRPNADLLPILKQYLHAQLPGLHIAALDCQEDSELQQKMKKEQRERKVKEGGRVVYRQASVSEGSSISSSDLSDLDEVEKRGTYADGAGSGDDTREDKEDEEIRGSRAKQRGTWRALGKDAKTKGKARKRRWGMIAKGREKLSVSSPRGAEEKAGAAEGEEKADSPLEVSDGNEDAKHQGQSQGQSQQAHTISRKEVGSGSRGPSPVGDGFGEQKTTA